MAAPSIVSYLWHFGDGTTSTEESPSHEYSMAGVFPLWVEMWDVNGNHYVVLESDYIQVYDWAPSTPSPGPSTGNSTASGNVAGFGGYNWVTQPEEGINVSVTDYCLRYAAHPHQGIGWSVYEGDDWPFPEGRVGCCQIMNDYDDRVQLVVDARTCRLFALGIRDQWVDGSGDYAGSEIESEILFREHTPPVGASAKLRHLQTHTYVKPWYKDRRNVGDYGSAGFRSGFSQDIFIRADSLPTDAAITEEIPREGQVVFDRHIVSPNLQVGVRLRGAPWRFPKTQTWFEQLDTAAAPPNKLMSEMTWALQWSEPFMWLSRGANLLMNLATATEATGTMTAITGPDGRARSAMSIGVGDSVRVTGVEAQSGDMAFSLWVRNPAAPTTLIEATTGNLQVRLEQVGAQWRLKWNDDGNDVTVALSGTLSSWVMLTVVRSGDDLVVYQNGVVANTVALADSTVAIGGAVTLRSGGGSLFDVRGVPRELTASAVEYAYNDVDQNSGNATLPVF